MAAYYNEFDANAAQWLRNLIKEGLIADGEVDTRSIKDLCSAELVEFTQRHWFAGIGGWGLALRLAGVPDDFRIDTGSCPCFPAGTLVITDSGYVPIEDINVGDMVLTHNGRFREVLRIGSEMSECITLKGQGHFGIECTPDHPFYVGGESWVAAKDMVGRMWGLCLPNAFCPP